MQINQNESTRNQFNQELKKKKDEIKKVIEQLTAYKQSNGKIMKNS